MKNLFNQLKGLSFEEGLKLIRENYEVEEQEIKDTSSNVIDYDLNLKDYEDCKYTFTGTYEKGEEEDTIDFDNGYWSMMCEGEHETHVGK